MVYVRFVEGLIAVDGPVLEYQIEHGNVPVAVDGPEFLVGVLENRNDDLELVDEHADVVFLDASANCDGDTGSPRFFILLHDSLDFGEVLLAVGALGAEVVDEQRALGKVAKENSRVADPA